jgi:uncharacterized membrane protein HdeD (DUF308 family)
MGPETPIVGPLLRSLAKNWWLLLLRGLAAIAFGVLAFIWPDLTLLSLTLIWGIYAISDGILALATAIAGGDAPSSTRWWLALVGVCGILAGVGTFLMPGLTALVLLMIIASWAIIIGALQIWGAIQLRKEIDNEWILILSGLLSLAFGILIMVMPGAGALSVVWTIGWFAVLVGCMYVGLAIRLRKVMLPR